MANLEADVLGICPQDYHLPNDIVDHLLCHFSDGPLLSDVAAKAIVIAENPTSSVRDITLVIESDPSLAMRILRIANSVLYSPATPILSLENAIARIGFRECTSIIYASCIARMLEKSTLADEWTRTVLRDHAFSTAILSRHLNELLSLGYQGEDFTCGLLHDLGRILIASYSPSIFQAGDDLTFGDESMQVTHEDRLWGSNHCEVGAVFVARSGLPAAAVDVIRHHHAPAEEPHPPLVTLVAAADHAANSLVCRTYTGTYDPSTNEYFSELISHRSPAERATLLEQFIELIGQTNDATSQMIAAFCS
ncbi:MAG: HDOD domain-containing protein [Pirellulaceae bacterium]|nr:HDOD domain-containing protein [Planctomycetales bacterium]